MTRFRLLPVKPTTSTGSLSEFSKSSSDITMTFVAARRFLVGRVSESLLTLELGEDAARSIGDALRFEWTGINGQRKPGYADINDP